MIQAAFVRFVLFTAAIAVVRRAASLYFVIDTVGFSTANDHHHHHAAYVTEVNRQQPPRRRCNGRPSQGAAPIAVSLAARSVMCASLCYTGVSPPPPPCCLLGIYGVAMCVSCTVTKFLRTSNNEKVFGTQESWLDVAAGGRFSPLSNSLCSYQNAPPASTFVGAVESLSVTLYVRTCFSTVVCTSDFLMFACNALPCGMDSSVILS